MEVFNQILKSQSSLQAERPTLRAGSRAGSRSLAVPTTKSRSNGVLDEYRAEKHGSSLTADRNMIICSVQEIGSLQNHGGAGKSF